MGDQGNTFFLMPRKDTFVKNRCLLPKWYGLFKKQSVSSFPGSFKTLMSWADEYRTMSVRANAETKADALVAKEFGAEGIGLVRTEHM